MSDTTETKTPESLFLIQLGRYGDLLNVFPMLLEASNNQQKPMLYVGEEFVGICEGISYADVRVYKGKIGQIRDAANKARVKYPHAKVTQTWGDDWQAPKKTENFQREQWLRAGMDRRFEQISLVIDKRSEAREAELLATELGRFEEPEKPLLLVNLNATSYPFGKAEKLWKVVFDELGGQFNVLDLAAVKCAKLYDLLGLMDVASCLITVDSMPLHLANASAVPVVALVADNSWGASLRRPNHIFRSAYSDINVHQLVSAVKLTAWRPSNQKIVHVYPEYEMSEADFERYRHAKNSWDREYRDHPGWMALPVQYDSPASGIRNSRDELGDTRAVPFVKDLIDRAIKNTIHPADIVLLTNTDVGFAPGVTEKLRRICALKGGCFSYRFDFDKVTDENLTNIQTVSGKHHGGLDFFAFTRAFWLKNRDRFPDAVLGCSMWDLHFRDLMKNLRCGELYGSSWHQTHHSKWIELGTTNVGNIHNGKLYNKFRKNFDRTRPFNL